MLKLISYLYFIIINCCSTNPGRTSPSTQEAIAGMLSIGQTYVQPEKSQKSVRYNDTFTYEEENVKNVHQDDDFGKRIN